jgi:hypothetical protein
MVGYSNWRANNPGDGYHFTLGFLHSTLSSNPDFPHLYNSLRLIEIASHYYDMRNFPQCPAKRELEAIIARRRPM